MGIYGNISTNLETITDSLSPKARYFRATDFDANQQLDNFNFNRAAVVWNNLAIATNSPGSNGRVNTIFPLSIRFLAPDEMDANSLDSEAIIDEMADMANVFYDKLRNSSGFLDPAAELGDAAFTPLIKIFDQGLSGVQMDLDLPLTRTVYDCQKLTL
jgi:hypothetical protein